MPTTLKVENLSKSFSKRPIFDNVTFNFNNGCYAIVGSNGVGKTILLEMLAGVLPSDSGSVQLSGIGVSSSIEYKQKLVYIPSKNLFFPSATGIDFINFILSVKKCSYENSNVEVLLGKFKLTNNLDTKFSDMSLGTQKKLFLSTLAIGDNAVIILDEPTNGLDSESNEHLYEILSELKKNAIIIMATHDPVLIKNLSPIMIELRNTTNFKLEVNNNYRLHNDEKILPVN